MNASLCPLALSFVHTPESLRLRAGLQRDLNWRQTSAPFGLQWAHRHTCPPGLPQIDNATLNYKTKPQ